MVSDNEFGAGAERLVYDFEQALWWEGRMSRVASFICYGWPPERQIKLLSKLYTDYMCLGEAALEEDRLEMLINLYGPSYD